ncbi:MAG TPA: copper amine oxidase N-terminal domain-containing protein [Symbiobacteriaceae bacterium]|nr:copper amine oxidase N-terminal domain-containing protein [Symbiobacteriaceae bacterium]
MRRLVSLLLSLVVLMAIVGPVQASSGIRVHLDGSELTFDADPFVENDRTLVPVRALSEALGFAVGWDEVEQRITLTRGETEIILWVDSTKVMVNGKESKLEVPVRKVGNRTFIPLRFVAETLGTYVTWDNDTQTAKVTSGKSLGSVIVKGLGQSMDQKAEGALDMSMIIAGDGIPNGAMALTTHMAIQAHLYHNQMLEQVAMQLPGSTTTMVSQVAAVNGKLYAKSGPDLPWTLAGNFNPANINELYGAMGIQGLDAAQLQKDLLGNAQVRVVGTTEIDGVQVLQVAIDLSKSGLDKAINQLVSSIPGAAGEMPNMTFQVDHYSIAYFVNQETGFIHRTDIDMDVTVAVKDKTEGGTIRLVLKGGINSRPTSEPIQWPADLPK